MILSPRVRQILDAEGISVPELETMVKLSAPHTEEEWRFNRRFHEWVFEVDSDKVMDMRSRLPFVIDVSGTAPSRKEVDHLSCMSEGCKICGWHGIRYRYY